MTTRPLHAVHPVTFLLLFTVSGVTAAECNIDSTETGAPDVIDLQGQGNFSCDQIAGVGGTMAPATGFQWSVDSLPGGRKVVQWSSDEQVDKIFVTASGQGSRCLYGFTPGATSGSYLEPAKSNGTTVVACSDGVEDEVPLALPEPISTATNCSDALPVVQESVDSLVNTDVDLAIVLGRDDGLNGQGSGDGSPVVGVCSKGSGGQQQCGLCKPPTDKVYSCPPLASGQRCLADRECATSDELPTGDPNAPTYCWELRDRVYEPYALGTGTNLDNGVYEPRGEEGEEKIFSVKTYPGSTCYWVTANYYGVWYGWWQCI